MNGGTLLTITGKGFGSVPSSNVAIKVAGSICAVQEVTDTTIKCITAPADSDYLQHDRFPGIYH